MKQSKNLKKRNKVKEKNSESSTKKYFKEILIGLLIVVVGGVIVFWLTNKQENNRDKKSRISCTLVINKIIGDSVYYNLKIKNIGQSTAKSIRYRVVLDEYQYGQSEKISQDLSKDESLNLFPMPIVNPYHMIEDIFSMSVFLYYKSHSGDDLIEHKNRFIFFIPIEQIFTGEYSPVNIIDDFEKIYTEAQLDSVALVAKLKKTDGSISYVFHESPDNQINYFFRFDSTALLYNPQSREIVFQKLFNDGTLLTIKKEVTRRDRNYHIVILNWFSDKYSLYINGDSAKIYDWGKIN